MTEDNKTNDKTDPIELLSKILKDAGITADELAKKLKKEDTKQNKITEEQADRLVDTVKTCLKTERPAIVLACCENEKEEVDKMSLLIKGYPADTLSLMSLIVCRALENLGVSLDLFYETTKKAQEKVKSRN